MSIDDESPTHVVNIEITYYRVRGGATRAFAGAMAGADNVTTITTVTARATGEELGRVKHVTRNPTAMVGINSLLRDHADKIVAFIRSGR